MGSRSLILGFSLLGLLSGLILFWVLPVRSPMQCPSASSVGPRNPLANLANLREILVLQHGIETAEENCMRLDDEMRAIRESAPAREQILAELIDGRLTLIAAAERFYEVSRHSTAYRQRFHSMPGSSPQEKVMRAVLSYVRGHAHKLPDEGRLLLAHLEMEFRSYCQLPDFIHLDFHESKLELDD